MNSPGVSVDAGDVAGLSIGSRTCDAKTFALPDGEAVHAIVFGEHRAARVDDRAAAHADPAAQKRAVSPDGMKQMSWLSGFAATASPRRAASSRICGLGVSPIGNAAWRNCSTVST